MFPNLIGTLASKGLSSLAESLFSTLIDKGANSVESTIKDVTGLDIDLNGDANDEIIGILSRNESKLTDALANLREENRHEEVMGKQALETFEKELESQKGAREQFARMQKSESWLSAHFLEVLTVIVLASTFILIYMLLFGSVNPDNKSLISTILEFLKLIDFTIIGFWYGSSKGSKDKTKEIVKTINSHDTLGSRAGHAIGDMVENKIDDLF